MVELQLPKLLTWVRFPSPAPKNSSDRENLTQAWRSTLSNGEAIYKNKLGHISMAECAAYGAGRIPGLAGVAQAADSTELWPEVSYFHQFSPGTRLYLDASYAKGKESYTESLDVSGFFDVAIKPIVRKDLRTKDWQRNRYLWARVGYTRIGKVAEGVRETPEDRGSLALYAKGPLPADVWLEARLRTDLRWVGDSYSTRYRGRIEASREFTVSERAVVPYFNVEWFYDTRYDGWSRTLFQGGVEVTMNKHFRYEVYLGRQNDHLPSDTSLNALGFVAKWYY